MIDIDSNLAKLLLIIYFSYRGTNHTKYILKSLIHSGSIYQNTSVIGLSIKIVIFKTSKPFISAMELDSS